MAALAAGAMLPALWAQAGKAPAKPAPGDWPMYAHDLASTRYSTLAQINAKNVTSLARSWTYKLGAGGETTPIVVNGTMFLPSGKTVVAVDAVSGKEVWNYALASGSPGSRGVAYWPGDRDNPPRIVFTAGPKLMALNANTGKIDPGFGKEGEVEIGVPWNGVPEVYKNVLMLGATVGEVPLGLPVTRAPSTPAPEPSCGSSTRCPSPAKRAMRAGSTRDGRAARASTFGAGT